MLPPASAAWSRRLLFGSNPIRRAIYIAGMIPAVWYFYLGVTDQLGADPQNTLERTLGLWALRFLILTLAITPLRRLGGPNLIRYRRAIGLLAFYYAALHLTVYMVLDQRLDLAAIWGDIVKRPYIAVGMLSFAILVLLAATSNSSMIRRLGAAAWQRLHRFVYVAIAAGAVHFVMLVKAWSPEPLIYIALVALLLTFRVAAYVYKRRRTTPVRSMLQFSRLSATLPNRLAPLILRREVASAKTAPIPPVRSAGPAEGRAHRRAERSRRHVERLLLRQPATRASEGDG
jgi:methionine sulfoxide reductase heme-binding subunit